MATTPPRPRTLGLLIVGQVSVWAATFLSVFFGPFAVQEMTGTFALGGLPFAMYYLSSLLVVVPAGRLMDRVGRAPVLAGGFALGAGGAIAIATGLSTRASAGLWAVLGFLAGLFLLSSGSSVAFLVRVAVTDLYPPDRRGQGLARILITSFAGTGLGAASFLVLSWGGVVSVGAVYLAMVPFFLAGGIAMAVLRVTASLPHPARRRGSRVGLRSLVRRPGIAWTVTGNAGAQAGMGGVMSFAGPALNPLGALDPVGRLLTGGILLGHFAGMFLPSPVAGHVADRRSRALAIFAGGAILATGAALFMFTALPVVAGIGLFLVGAGWCFTFIPGTAILADSTSLEERGSLFGTNDAIVSLTGATVTLFAGFAFFYLGSLGLGVLGVACGLLPVAAGLALNGRRRVPGAAGANS